jgi:hypothetical protein
MYLLNLKLCSLIEDDMNSLILFINFFIIFLCSFLISSTISHKRAESTVYLPGVYYGEAGLREGIGWWLLARARSIFLH